MGVGSCVPAIILIIIGVLFQPLPALCNTVTFDHTNPPHTTTMSTDVTFKEGYATFPVPGIEDKPCQTYYQVIGDLHSGHAPIVALNGGPGANYQYLLILSDVTKAKGNALVVYDQIGIGKSTHYREKAGDTSFWVDQLFLDQLDNLLAHLGIKDRYIVFGHSWGGMLASRHAVQRPPGLTHLILMSAPADMHLWVTAQNRLRTELPQDVQDVLTRNEEAGTTDSEEYQAAVAVFYSKFLCRIDPMPDAIAAGFAEIEADPTVYMTMNGPSEFYITGSLLNWTIIDDAHKIQVPTLLANGRYDEAQDEVMEPFAREIKDVRWVKFENSSHMAHWEERDKFMQEVASFLSC